MLIKIDVFVVLCENLIFISKKKLRNAEDVKKGRKGKKDEWNAMKINEREMFCVSHVYSIS